MNKTIFAASALVASHLSCQAVDLGGAAALDVNNWTTDNEIYVQGTAGGSVINWENVLTNTAAANIANNNFDVTFEADINYTIGRLFLYNDAIDLSTLPPGGIQQLQWVADFEATGMANWIPVIAVTDAGATNFYRSNNTGNTWNGNGSLSFVAGAADNNFWVGLGGDPVGGINDSRVGGISPDLQAATGMVQFGFVQWGASTGGSITPALDFTTAIDQFDITINETQEVAEMRPSSQFANQYAGGDIYDGISYFNDWDLPGVGGTNVVSGLDEGTGILTVTNDDNNGWIQQDNGASPWEIGTAKGGSFTIEIRIKLANDPGNGFVMWAANGSHRGILQIDTNQVSPFGLGPIDFNDNTDDFHTFRIAYEAEFGLYFFWRDGVSLTPEGGVAPQANTGNNRLLFGDCCSSYLMTSFEIDYVRYDTTGAFAPGPDTPLDITAVSYDEDTGMITLTWRSVPGSTYVIQGSEDLASWPIEIDDSTPASPKSDTTSITFLSESDPPVPGTPPGRIYYRVLPAE